MTGQTSRMVQLTKGLSSKSAKMRVLAKAGYGRAEIARFLGTRYQFVRNVLVQEEARQRGTGAAKESDASASAKNVSLKVRVGPDGRVVIPAGFRETLGLKEGDVLFARLEDGEINLLTPTAAMRRAQAMLRQFVPEGVSLVDELIADRRREVEREAGRG